MAKIEITDDLVELCRNLKEIEAEITRRTGSKKPGAVATEVLQLAYLNHRGFKDYYLDSNCALEGIDAVAEDQDPLQLKNTDGDSSYYWSGKSKPMHKIAEDAVACDPKAKLVFTRMETGEVVDCVVGPAFALLGWRTRTGKGLQGGNYNTLVKKFGFERI